jgi:pyridinium-3,5-bisthiocarboxylic acid mononucleotide nickel chelatase
LGKTLYFDCFSGASGDMVLGALLDLGLPLEALREALGSLAVEYGQVTSERVLRTGISATKFRLVDPPSHLIASTPALRQAEGRPEHSRGTARQGHRHDHGHSHSHGQDHGHEHEHDHHHSQDHAGHHAHHSLTDIGRYIDRSALSASAKKKARDLFTRLAEAEAAIHDMPVERVHLHEVGAVDSIIDIVGAVFGMEWLGATRVVASPMNVGSGTVRCAHGVFPVPAPATVRLLQGTPIYSQGVATELTTPTGALLVTAYADSFGPMPPMRVTAIGYGAGDKDFTTHPNVLRLLVGEDDEGGANERILSIQCEIDDMNPQLFGPLMDRLSAAGALDVYYAPVQMKKNRPGTLVTIIAPPGRREAISGVLFTETTTIGVRYQEMQRERLEREIRTVETPVGAIRFKVAHRGGAIVNAAPEFEDCARIAAEQGLPIKEVQARAIKAWMDRGA